MSNNRLQYHDVMANVQAGDAKASQDYPHDVWVEVLKPDAEKENARLAKSERNRLETAMMKAANIRSSTNLVRQVVAIMQSYPLRPVFEKQMVMATDGLVTFFNPFVTQALSNEEAVAVMIHESGHQLYGDVVQSMEFRRRYRHMFWRVEREHTTPNWFGFLENLFIDPVVNNIVLDSASIGNNSFIDTQFLRDHNERCYITLRAIFEPVFDKAIVSDPAIDNTTGDITLDSLLASGNWPRIYELSTKSSNGTSDKWMMLHRLSLLLSRVVDGAPPIDDNLRGLGDIQTANADKTKANTVKAKQQAAVTNAAKSTGSDPGDFGIEIPTPVYSNQVQDNLPQIINGILDKTDYSFAMADPHQAQMGVIRPIPDQPPGCIAVALDVSGSVVYSTDEFSVLLGELKSALDNPRIDGILLVPYDYGDPKESNVIWLEPGDDIEAVLNIDGGGGTSFDPPIKYIEEHEDAHNFSCIINLTDGEARFGGDPSWNIPRVWVSTSAPTSDLDKEPSSIHILLEDRRNGAVG